MGVLSRKWIGAVVGGVLVVVIVGGIIFALSHTSNKNDKQPSNPIAQQYSKQLPSLKEKAKKNPKSFQDQENYAVALYATGDTKAAQQQYQKAAELNNRDATVQNNLGNTYRDQGNFNAAVTAYRKAITLNPKLINPYTNLANIQIYSLNKTDDGIATYKAALKQLPTNPQLQVLLALAYEQEGDKANAKQTLLAAQATNPNDKTIQQNLSRLE